jgi:CspA family cold shock protein
MESISTENITNNRETGIVKRFSKEKGYGFISKNSDGTDCFVQYVIRILFLFFIFVLFFQSFKSINSAGFKTLDQGQEVEFTVVQGEKGVEAKVSCIHSKSYQTIILDKKMARVYIQLSSLFENRILSMKRISFSLRNCESLVTFISNSVRPVRIPTFLDSRGSNLQSEPDLIVSLFSIVNKY